MGHFTRFAFSRHGALPVAIAFTLLDLGTARADTCPAGEVPVREDECAVCRFPDVLRATGAMAGGVPCFTCDPDGSSELVHCEQYWDEALDAIEFSSESRMRPFRRYALAWSRALAHGREDTVHGRRLLKRAYAGSVRGYFASQADALRLLAGITHFATQLGEEGPWPPLRTSLEFTQLSWLTASGATIIPSSHVASARLQPGVLETQMLDERGGAWANLVVHVPSPPGPLAPLVTTVAMPFDSAALAIRTAAPFPPSEDDWRVRNWYISFANAADLAQTELRVFFGLGTPDGVVVPNVEFQAIVKDEPVTYVEIMVDIDTGNFQFGPVEPEDHLVGGLDDGIHEGGGSELHVPDGLEVWDGCPDVDEEPEACQPADPPVRVGPVSIPLADIPVVNEFVNHCVPGAIARGLKILFGDELPSAQVIMEEIRIDMGTNGASEGGADAGTFDSDILPGKAAYGSRHGLVGLSTSLADEGTFANQVDQAIATLEAGGVVEILIGWVPAGGHVALVKEIVKKPNGGVQITYVDDPTQGDNTAENAAEVIHCDDRGKFHGNTACVEGFVLERKN